MREAQELISCTVQTITGDSQCFAIEASIDENGVLLLLSVDKEQAGRVIGKKGQTANAMRCILRALGTKNHAKYNLKVEVIGE